ncbi:MAG: DUF2029 domain-containing protein [Candidatus Wallbacteria bacterium]|nr:DUF2029 domain-containing protein [Candidatus Wallbacteria bacterium]
METNSTERYRRRTLRLLLTGFAGATLAFVPSWLRILEGTWPAWVLAAHGVALTAAAVALGRQECVRPRQIVWLCLFAAAVPSAFLMAMRAATAPGQYVHDSAVQSEEAMRFLLQGKDPYAESFANTPMAQVPFFGGKNPALEHIVYYPGSFLLSLPLRIVVHGLTGWYDHRLFLLICYGAALWGAWRAAESQWRCHLMVAVGLNPAFNFYLIQGANDAAVAGLLLVALALSQGGRSTRAAICVGAAAAFKQTAWFFGVLAVADALGRRGPGAAARAAVVMAAAMLALTLPFVVWDRAAFFDDTYAYLSGTAKESYPAAGLSIANLTASYAVDPATTRKLFSVLQLGVVLPMLLFCAWRQARLPGADRLAWRYGLVVTAAFVCGRYFNASHLAYVSLFLIASWLLPGARNGSIGAAAAQGGDSQEGNSR